jgi:hypothetical protein
VFVVTPVLRIHPFWVVKLSSRVIDFQYFEGGAFLQILGINDPPTHCTTFMYKGQGVFKDALTPGPL